MKKLGGELQRSDLGTKTSEIEARKIFFQVIGEMVPSVHQTLFCPWIAEEPPPEELDRHERILDLRIRFALLHAKDPKAFKKAAGKLGSGTEARDTPFLAYFDLLHKSSASIARIAAKIEPELLPIKGTNGYNSIRTKRILKELIPDWKTINENGKAKKLCKSLENWGARFHLHDNWIFDAALEGFALIKADVIDRVNLPDDYLISDDTCFEFRNYVCNGAAWNLVPLHWTVERFYENAVPESGMPPNVAESELLFKFRWKVPGNDSDDGFDIEEYFNPLFHTKEMFVRSVEEKFWAAFCRYYLGKESRCVGRTGDIGLKIKDFEKRLDAFTKGVLEKVGKNSTVTPSVNDDSQFRWLVDRQINKLTWVELENKYGRDRKTIREGVERAAGLIGLTLRKEKRGRPKGSRTKRVGVGRVR